MDGSTRMVLTFLFVLGVMDGHAAEYALNVTAGTSRAWESDAIGYNGKMQGDPWYNKPFETQELRDVLTRSMIGTFRYPSGTGAVFVQAEAVMLAGEPKG